MAANNGALFDREEIVRTLRAFHAPDEVFELRIMKPHGHNKRMDAGWFNSAEEAATWAARYSGNAVGVYHTLNPVKAGMLARASNRIKEYAAEDSLTKDTDIAYIHWFVIDLDPRREDGVTGISSTDEEKQLASNLVAKIRHWLKITFGFYDPLVADSGNGYHLCYRIRLEPSQAGLLQQCLAAIAHYWENDFVDIDLKVFNPARIWKLYGTIAAKGDHTPERPHRLAHINELPEPLEVNPEERIQALAATAPKGYKPDDPAKTDWAEWWVSSHSLVGNWRSWKVTGKKFVFAVCPWNAQHTDNSAFIVVQPDGAIGAGCHHNGCAGKGWPEMRDVIEPDWRTKAGGAGGKGVVITSSGGRYSSGRNLTELGNAERILDLYGDVLHYVKPWKTFVEWDGKRWAIDELGTAISYSFQMARSIYVESANESDPVRRARLAHWAVASESSGKLKMSLDLFKGLKGVTWLPDIFDSNPWLLNFNNGTLNLKTGEFYDHNPDDFITKLIPVNYDFNATAPTWEAAVRLSFSRFVPDGDIDPEATDGLVRYFQEILGYSLTGSQDLQLFFMCWGASGNNGKSTLLEGYARTLGSDYSGAIDPDVLVKGSYELAAWSSLAQMRGKRFVNMNEATGEQALNHDLLKKLTGDDTIRAKMYHQDTFEFIPTFKLFMRTNEKPDVHNQGNPVWRRIKTIPFDYEIPAELRRPRSELDAAFDRERVGIINWAYQGLKKVWANMESGLPALDEPKEVAEAIKVYREESDQLRQFMADAAEVGDGSKAEFGSFYKAYQIWARDNGHRFPLSSKKIGQRLEAMGLHKEREGKSRILTIHGVELLPEWESRVLATGNNF